MFYRIIVFFGIHAKYQNTDLIYKLYTWLGTPVLIPLYLDSTINYGIIVV